MPDFLNPTYLVSDQYKDASNLNARIQLHERFSTNPYGWFHWVFDQLDLPAQAKILETGCGSGLLWSDNLRRIPAGWHIILSDFSPGMIRNCQVNLASAGNHFTHVVPDGAAISFLAETYDAVIANHMLYHLPDRARALSDIARILRPDGCLYAATNGENHLLELDMIIEQNIQASNTGLFPGNRAKDFNLKMVSLSLLPGSGRLRAVIMKTHWLLQKHNPCSSIFTL